MKKETRRSEKMKERSSVCNIRLLFFSFAVVRQNAALTSTDRIVKNEEKKTERDIIQRSIEYARGISLGEDSQSANIFRLHCVCFEPELFLSVASMKMC